MVLAERSSTWVVGFVVPAAIWLIIIAYWIGTSQPKLDGPANSATPSEAAILDAPRKAADATASPKPRSVEHTAAASRNRGDSVTSVNMEEAAVALAAKNRCTVDEFPEVYATLRANSNMAFSEQYRQLSSAAEDFDAIESSRSSNRAKNRYNNILPYDHSRVVLEVDEDEIDEDVTDYINANFIAGLRQERMYIATQGPTPRTFPDFWRMIWQYECPVVIMVTNLVERGTTKCHQYWPKGVGDSADHGPLRVMLSGEEEAKMGLVHRTLLLTNMETSQTRVVHQLQLVGWPDHGVPRSPELLLNMIQHAHQLRGTSKSPVVVHCSAGVGRSGTYIATDINLQRMQETQTVAVFDTVVEMRKARMYMVQTEDQYVHIHAVLLEALRQGATSLCDVSKFSAHVAKQSKLDRRGFRKEFMLLARDTGAVDFYSSQLSINSRKNRYANQLALERSRVVLRELNKKKVQKLSEMSDEARGEQANRRRLMGQDYINANYVDGCERRHHYIATQCPLPNRTVEAFWTMVWQENSQVIVALMGDELNGYLPLVVGGEPLHVGMFTITPVDETPISDADCVRRTITVTLTQPSEDDEGSEPTTATATTAESEQRTLVHYEYRGWPVQVSIPSDVVSFVALARLVQPHDGPNVSVGPLIVHCSGGSGRTGVFLGLLFESHRERLHKTFDVFRTTRAVRAQRANAIMDVEQYTYLHKALLYYVTGAVPTSPNPNNNNAKNFGASHRGAAGSVFLTASTSSSVAGVSGSQPALSRDPSTATSTSEPHLLSPTYTSTAPTTPTGATYSVVRGPSLADTSVFEDDPPGPVSLQLPPDSLV